MSEQRMWVRTSCIRRAEEQPFNPGDHYDVIEIVPAERNRELETALREALGAIDEHRCPDCQNCGAKVSQKWVLNEADFAQLSAALSDTEDNG